MQEDHSNDFSISTDGKFIIKDEEENSTEMEGDEKFNIGAQDMLAGTDWKKEGYSTDNGQMTHGYNFTCFNF